jgi:hypothetical protein
VRTILKPFNKKYKDFVTLKRKQMKTHSPFPLLFKSIGEFLKGKPFLSFLMMAFFAVNAIAQNTANIIIQPASTTTSVGQTFVVSARVDMTSGSIDDAEVHLTFDKTKLQVLSITKPSSSIMPNEVIPLQSISTINTNGQINYNAGTTSSFPTTDFNLLSITFSVIAGGGTSTPLTYLTVFPNKTNAWRSGPSILSAVTNGAVTISGSCTPPTGTLTASSGASICNGQPVGLKLSAATGASPYTLVVNSVTYPNVTVGATTFASIPFPTYKIWPSTTNLAVTTQNDGSGIETGVKFTSAQAGFIKGVRFYSGDAVSGTYKGKLWNFATSTLMASANYTSVTANGWQEIMFATPVSIAANTTYLATMYSSTGNYVATDNYFTSAVTNGPLTAMANSVSPNGIYFFGAQQSGPVTDWNTWNQYLSTNYWVDVIFTPNTNTINLTSITDANGCNVTGALQTINVVSANCSSLPVSLLNLSASPQGSKVTLRWATSSEMNNRGFDIQRSTDGTNWTTIGFVTGAGNSNSVKNYTYMDQNLEPKKYFYRLKQIDIDDHFKYSAVVSATLNGKAEFSLGQNYPNPFNSQTTIQFILPKAENVNLSLFDVSGRVVKVLVNGSKEAGTHAINVNTGALTKGVYYYKIQAGDFTDVKKLTIQ